MKPFLLSGFQVAIMDYRGYGLSTGTPTHLNIRDDARKLMALLLEREDIVSKPLIVLGTSIGTQVATLVTAENESKVDLLILDSAMKSFTDIALVTSPAEYHDIIRQYLVSPYSVIESIGAVSHPKLLAIHSETDWVPIEGAREIYEAAVVQNKVFWTYEGAHATVGMEHSDELVKRVVDMLAR